MIPESEKAAKFFELFLAIKLATKRPMHDTGRDADGIMGLFDEYLDSKQAHDAANAIRRFGS